MKNIKLFLASFFMMCCVSFINARTGSSEIVSENGNITLYFGSKITSSLQKSSNNTYTIERAKGRFGNYQAIGTTGSTSFVDENIEGNPYDYYYRVVDAQGERIALLALDLELFGSDMYFYSPTDEMNAISREINMVHDRKMRYGHWSSERYAFYFKPGDYTAAGGLYVGFYTHIGGLGKIPNETKISNLFTPPYLTNNNGNNATQTFWRSTENLAIMGTSGNLMWGVSQAAPIRRVYSQRNVQFDWNGGWASGGFAADCYFASSAGSYSQQQWYTRNSYSHLGRGGFGAGVWNTCYQGMEFGPNVNMSSHSDNWATGGAVSNVETSPVIREKPFLFIDSDGRYKVFRPGLRKDAKGPSWSETNMGEGTVFDILDDFYVVKPGTSAETMNEQLDAGKHLFITPGKYELSEPLHVKRENTIILGTGFSTLAPAAANNETAILIDDVPGVTIASVFLDALYNSRTLIQVGPKGADKNFSENPTLLADVFVRAGGTKSGNTNVDISMEINSSDVIGDHFWLWRADHGSGVGWNTNTSKNGLVVNGDYVTIYGLFNEHFQEYQNIWNGEKGRAYFFQCETPYDIGVNNYTNPETGNGWAAYKVADHVQWHEASMLGIYVVMNRGSVNVQSSIEVPNRTGIKIHHACNVKINGQGYRWIINETGPSTLQNNSQRLFVVDFVGTEPSLPASRPDDTGITQTPLENGISIFFNPDTNYLQIESEDKNVAVAVSDVSGRAVYKQTGIETIDMRTYPKGVYLVAVSSANAGSKVEKIFKQ